ncbi:MAG: hypothetical protein M0R46_18115 [Candidatus Muirbacterium halophilum]|nr:hypothetical protein [Candidatus Muirbacterium halophilum]
MKSFINRNKFYFWIIIIIINFQIRSLSENNLNFYKEMFIEKYNLFNTETIYEKNLLVQENVLFAGEKCFKVSKLGSDLYMMFLKKKLKLIRIPEEQYFNKKEKIEKLYAPEIGKYILEKLNINKKELFLDKIIFKEKEIVFHYKQYYKGYFFEIDGISIKVDLYGNLILYTDFRSNKKPDIKINISLSNAIKKAEEIINRKYSKVLAHYIIKSELLFIRPNYINGKEKLFDYSYIYTKW